MNITLAEHVPPLTTKHIFSLAIVDPKSYERRGCLENSFNDPISISQRFAYIKDELGVDLLECIRLKPSTWSGLGETSLRDVFAKRLYIKAGEPTSFLRRKFQIVDSSMPKFYDFGELPYRIGSIKEFHKIGSVNTVSLLLQDSEGQRIRTAPIMLPDLVARLASTDRDDLELDALFVCVIQNGYIVAVILDAVISRFLDKPSYSIPSQRNVELALLHNFQGKSVSISLVKPELERLFKVNLSYDMVRRALHNLAERLDSKENKEKTFQLPTLQTSAITTFDSRDQDNDPAQVASAISDKRKTAKDEDK